MARAENWEGRDRSAGEHGRASRPVSPTRGARRLKMLLPRNQRGVANVFEGAGYFDAALPGVFQIALRVFGALSGWHFFSETTYSSPAFFVSPAFSVMKYCS